MSERRIHTQLLFGCLGPFSVVASYINFCCHFCTKDCAYCFNHCIVSARVILISSKQSPFLFYKLWCQSMHSLWDFQLLYCPMIYNFWLVCSVVSEDYHCFVWNVLWKICMLIWENDQDERNKNRYVKDSIMAQKKLQRSNK